MPSGTTGPGWKPAGHRSACTPRLGPPSTPWRPVAAAVVAISANLVGVPLVLFVGVIASSALLAAFAYLVQVRANEYLRAVHPDGGAAPLTAGEILAATLGGLALLAVVGILFLL